MGSPGTPAAAPRGRCGMVRPAGGRREGAGARVARCDAAVWSRATITASKPAGGMWLQGPILLGPVAGRDRATRKLTDVWAKTRRGRPGSQVGRRRRPWRRPRPRTAWRRSMRPMSGMSMISATWSGFFRSMKVRMLVTPRGPKNSSLLVRQPVGAVLHVVVARDRGRGTSAPSCRTLMAT